MRLLFLIVVSFVVVSKGFARDTGPFGCDDGDITVGVTDLGIVNNHGAGFDADLLQLLSEMTGCELNVTPVAREQVFELVEQGKIDFVPSVARQPQRESYAWFIPYYEVRFLLLTNAKTLPPITELDQLKNIPGVRIAKAIGSGYGPYFNYHLSDMESLGVIRSYSNYGQTVVALLNGEVDATLSVPLIYRNILAQHQAAFPLRISDVSPESPTAVALMLGKHRFSSAQAANWLRMIETVRLNGRFKAILENYVTQEEANSMLSGVSLNQN